MKNTFVKVLSFLMALTMIVGTLGTVVVFAAECTHEPAGEPVAVVPATCDTAGYTRYLCKHCGEEYIDPASIQLATGEHAWVDAPAIPATCDEPGYVAHKVCSKCNKTQGKVENPADPALGHKWLIEHVVPATCTEDGYTTMKCARCLKEDDREFTCAGGHATTDPEGNPITPVCDCDRNERGWKVVIPATGHKHIYTVTEVPHDCEGGKVTITCEACDYNNVVVNEAKHVWKNMDPAKIEEEESDAESVKEAVSEALEAIDKSFGNTCGDDYKAGSICIVCGLVKDTQTSSGTCSDFDHVVADVDESDTTDEDGFYAEEKYVVDVNNYEAEMANVGGKTFEIGSATYKEAAHGDDGWVLVFCNDCQKYSVLVIDGGEHNYNAGVWTDANGVTYSSDANAANYYKAPKYHNIAMTLVKTCVNKADGSVIGCGHTYNADTKAADPTHDYDWKDGAGKQQGTVETFATCTDNGFIRYTCEHCGYTYDELTDTKTGHNFGEWGYVSGYECGAKDDDDNEITANQMVRTCQNVDRNKTGDAAKCNEKEYKASPANKTHVWEVKKDAEATCMANAIYKHVCADCGKKVDLPEGVTAPVSGLNSANHVVTADQTKGVWVEELAAATCTVAQKDKYRCECGEYVEVTGEALGHGTKVTKWCSDHKQNVDSCTAACASKTKDVSARLATCKDKGIKTAGEICQVCGVITKDPVAYDAVNPNAHEATGVQLEADTNTCMYKAYTLMYYSCCQKDQKIELTGESVKIDNTNHIKFSGTNDGAYNAATGAYANKAPVDMRTFVPAKAATCAEDGYCAHFKCTCGKVFVATWVDPAEGETVGHYEVGAETTAAALKIAKKSTNGKHDFTDATKKHSKVEEQCTVYGQKEYIECKNGCGYIQVDGKAVLPHHDDKETATDLGYNIWEEIEIPNHGDTLKVRYSAYYANVLKPTLKAPTCTDGAWIEPSKVVYAPDEVKDGYVCSKCVIDKKPAKYWAGKLYHTNTAGLDSDTLATEDTFDSYVVNNTTADDYNCTMPTYTIDSCARCDYEYFIGYTTENVKEDHTWAKDEDGNRIPNAELSKDAKCNEAGIIVYKCTVCKYTETEAGAPAKGHYITLANGTEQAITFSCKNDAWKEFVGLTCAGGCGWTVTETKVEEIGHKKVTSEAAATCTTDGYRIQYCSDCNKTFYAETVAPKDKNYEHSTQSVLREVKDGVEIYYCPDCESTFEKAVVVNNVVTATASSASVTAGSDVTVTVKLSGKANEFKETKIEVAYDAGKFDFVEATSALTSNVFTATYTKTVGTGDDAVEVDYVGVTIVSTTAMANTVEGTDLVTLKFTAKKYAVGDTAFTATAMSTTSAAAAVKVVGLGNPTGTGYVTGEDALAILELDDVADYDASYDINGDGMIDVLDVILVGTFAASTQTAKDYLVMVGTYGEIESTIDALYEDGLLADVTKDGNVNINDFYKLTTAVDAKLATYTSYKDIDFASVEELVMSVMISLIA